MKVILVDPSRFTAPYDAELSEGLASAGVKAIWATRPVRAQEAELLPPSAIRGIFYRNSDNLDKYGSRVRSVMKGISHLAGLLSLARLAASEDAKVIHFQWSVLPIFDAIAMSVLRLRYRVILTAHDTVPYNGEKISFLQNFGFDLPIRIVDGVIVHTEAAAARLVERGHKPRKIVVVPHGPLPLGVDIPAPKISNEGDPWTFTLFGQIKPYKGLDVLIKALSLIRDEIRGKAKIIIAGAAHMDMAPIIDDIAAYGLSDLVDLRLGRLSEEEVAELFVNTDCFLFPYRQIDASGVFFLVSPFKKWVIASDVGVFQEQIKNECNGTIVQPENPSQLADAILQAAKERPSVSAESEIVPWKDIGILTKEVYSGKKHNNKDHNHDL
ncbi:MAG: glycosyltransferase family 4 protein [Pseudomonadota bacterium]